MHQRLAHEPLFGDNRTATLINSTIMVHIDLFLHYYGAFCLHLFLPRPVIRGLQR